MAKKKKSDKASIKITKSTIVQESAPPPEPRFLAEDAIYFWTNIDDKAPTAVPPPTPRNISDVKTVSDALPKVFPKLDDLEIPYVREVGVRRCIEVLGEHLGCKNYAIDYLQFWLLDILTDCLWKAQDEYHLDVQEQKLVLSWVLYMFQIMTDPKLSYSRRTFFNVFKEAILIAGDIINEGEADVPPPDKLFTLARRQENEEEAPDEEAASDSDSTSSGESSSAESGSTITISTYESKDIVEMEVGDETRTYVIKKKMCDCTLDESIESYTTTESTTATPESPHVETESDENGMEQRDDVAEEEEKIEEYYAPVQCKDYEQFYRADASIPKRFLPLQEEQTAEEIEEERIRECEEISTEQSSNLAEQIEEENTKQHASKEPGKRKKFDVDFSYLDEVSSSVLCQKSVPERNPNEATRSDVKVDGEALSDSQVLKQLARYKLWEQRLKDMDDSEIGWMHDGGSEESSKKKNSSNSGDATDETVTEEEEMGDRKLICFGVLCTIIDFVFDYFYRSFHFTLMKLSTRATQNVITQQLNDCWNVPKTIKRILQKPKPTPRKKEKKEKKSKGSKKTKDKKSKKSSKDKKSKKSDKSGKGKKGKKKEAKKKLTKEEKAELERQRKLREEMEAEFKRLEDNKRYMFPLADAANDELFTGIFENWVKPKEKKEKGKKDKGKKKKK